MFSIRVLGQSFTQVYKPHLNNKNNSSQKLLLDKLQDVFNGLLPKIQNVSKVEIKNQRKVK